jgi:NAD(P)H-dependent FMN reductase
MNTILAFSGSNSSTSINHQLLQYTISHILKSQADEIDLKSLNVPIYSEDIEKSVGIPQDILNLKDKLDQYPALLIAVNEHNGTMSAFFKNITDWLSRTDSSYLNQKKIFILATSPGGGGAKLSLDYTSKNFTKFGGDVLGEFSLPHFQNNFLESKLSVEFDDQLKTAIAEFENQLVLD